MNEEITRIEEVMSIIDKNIAKLKEYPVSNNEYFKNLCFSLKMLDVELDKIFKPENYKRRIKEQEK